jgi:hypothetical protein
VLDTSTDMIDQIDSKDYPDGNRPVLRGLHDDYLDSRPENPATAKLISEIGTICPPDASNHVGRGAGKLTLRRATLMIPVLASGSKPLVKVSAR